MGLIINITSLSLEIPDGKAGYPCHFKKERKLDMAKPKENSRLTTEDIVSLLSKRSNLTKAQIKECFIVFAELYNALMCSENTPFDFTMPLPYIGTFKSRVYHGKKKGSTYFVGFDKENRQKVVVEEDRPDFVLPVFVVKPEIARLRKEASKKRWSKGYESKEA